jgi:DNA ligase (NAD+)
MNIDGLGAETIELFYNKGLIRNYADLYDLNGDQIMNLDRFQQKSTENILMGIQNSKAIPFERVLYGMGIRYVGETVAKKLARHYRSIDNLMRADAEELMAVDEIGEAIAKSVVKFFDDSSNIQLIERLRSAGIQMEMEDVQLKSNVLEGKKIVVSGVFKNFEREHLKKIIELHGGSNASSISAKTDFVLAGEGMGPSKLEKATKLGVEIMNEDSFMKLIGEK